MKLTLNTDWLERDFTPATLTDSPFKELPCRPKFAGILESDFTQEGPWKGSLESYAAALVACVDWQLAHGEGPMMCLLSGGYDSRLIAALLERQGADVIYFTDGDGEPQCSDTLDLLGVEPKRRFTWEMGATDPYGLVNARCDGWAPLYSQMRFFPSMEGAFLVSGLGGGEWFSYPAGGWHNGKAHRLPHTSVVSMWLDCWPQYALLPDAWKRGFAGAIYPYCTVPYASLANRCRDEWLVEVDPKKALDKVRKAMLDTVDERLAPLGWVPHDYDWRLSPADRLKIDTRYQESWLAQTYGVNGSPSRMDKDDHACTLAGFATWCDRLIAEGHQIR